MDIMDKLELILKTLSSVEAKLEDVSEKQDQLAESISDLGKPGSGYSIFDPED